MAEHPSYELSESLSFAPMFRSETEGQSHNLYQQGSMSGLSQFEVSNHLPCEACDGTGSTMNGIDPSGNTAYWGNTSPVSSVGLNRNKAQLGVYQNDWSSHCHQQEATESYETAEHQKLDSFSEAFCSRSTSQMMGGEDQSGFSTPSNNSTPSHALSFPLVLSPPPTPLPPSSFSPPKRHQHFLSGQILSQSQMQTPTDGSLQFIPSLPSPSSGRFDYPNWPQLPAEDNESGNITQHLPQEFSPSLVHSDQTGPHMRQINSPLKDCSQQMSLSSALAQHHHSQSCVQLQLGLEPGTSEDQMTWPQLSHTFGPSLHQSSIHGQESGPGEGSRFTSGFNFSAGSSDKPLVSHSTQNAPIVVYTGVPFNSVIQLGRELMENREGTMSHFTPLPMLNPTRSATGLFCNLRSPLTVENRAELTEERKDDDDSHGCINIGPEFQAELPDLTERDHRVWPEESVREEMLWKPWMELEENDTLLEQVENLLDLSASSVLPGGGANLELALHSLSHCQGNILAALEMLLFSNSVPSKDYHYSGTDMWTLNEQRLFHKALTIYGKDFFFIHKMVRTKQVLQCVEYYYKSKRLSEKQRKQSEREKVSEEERNAVVISQVSPAPKMLVNQANIERQIHTQPLPTSFPCKQCGKMFYKIKSRNAHMKIHRQQQEDWKDKLHIHSNQHHNLNITRALVHANQQVLTQTHHQNHILTQSLIQNLVQSQTQLAFLQSTKTPGTCPSSSTSCMTPTQNPQIVSKAPPLQLYTGHHQTWGSLHSVETGGLFYN